MPTLPTIPTDPAVMSEERILYEVLKNMNYLAQLSGVGAPTIPTNPAVLSEHQLLYQILLNLNYWAGQAGASDINFLQVINKTGGPLAKDALVRVSGWDATAGKFTIVLADADASAGSGADYVLLAAIADNAEGIVYKMGLSAATLNTNAAGAVGDPVYLSTTAGGWTLTAPTGNDDIVQEVGTVRVKSATVGQIAWNVQTSQIIGVNNIQNLAVTGAKLATGILRMELVAGQDETGDTTIPVTGLAAGDELVGFFVENGTSGIQTQRANADFTVGASNLTVVANAANNAANKYLVTWIDRT